MLTRVWDLRHRDDHVVPEASPESDGEELDVFYPEHRFDDTMAASHAWNRPHVSEPATGRNMVVVSYNMSWAVQEDVVAGSEIEYVRSCKRRFGHGSMKESGIAACTSNALRAMHVLQPTIIGVQEAQTTEFCDRYVEWFASHGRPHMEYVHATSGRENSAIFYDSSETGLGRRVGPARGFFCGEEGRACCAAYFRKMHTVVVNLHAPHFDPRHANAKLLSALREVFDTVTRSCAADKLPVDRVLVTGDFNDAHDVIGDDAPGLEVCGHQVLRWKPAPVTCCRKGGALALPDARGDYVLSSTPVESLFSLSIPYSSDHDPVVAVIPARE